MEFAKIKDICSFLPKSKIKAGEGLEDGQYVFFTSSDIKSRKINDYLYDEEAIILGTGGKPSCNYYNGKFSVSTDNFVLKSSIVNIKYLYYFLRHNNLSVLEKGFHGAGLKHISKDYVNDIMVPICDSNKQRIIVDDLDYIHHMIETYSSQLYFLETIVKSQFIEMFNKNSYDKSKLNDLCLFLRNGMSIKQERNAKGFPITRIETLSNSTFNRNKLGYANIMNLNDKHLGYILEDGDLLISHINSEQFVGRIVQYHKIQNETIIHGMNLLCMRMKDLVNPTYIEFYFKTEEAKKYISSITKRAINQASMAVGDLKNMTIDLPPMELQNKFASFVQQIDKSKYIKCIIYKKIKKIFIYIKNNVIFIIVYKSFVFLIVRINKYYILVKIIVCVKLVLILIKNIFYFKILVICFIVCTEHFILDLKRLVYYNIFIVEIRRKNKAIY